MNREKLFVDESTFKILVKLLACRLAKQSFNSLYGIPRGGSVVAVYLSHLLNIPIVATNKIAKDTLICEDIVDSGNTLLGYKKRYSKNVFASLFVRNAGVQPNYCIINAEDYWIVFPWELK